jgi:hypothetical protein
VANQMYYRVDRAWPLPAAMSAIDRPRCARPVAGQRVAVRALMGLLISMLINSQFTRLAPLQFLILTRTQLPWRADVAEHRRSVRRLSGRACAS